MWNSPNTFSEAGKRYSVEDLSALILPLDELLILIRDSPVADHVEEQILRRLEREELVFALSELFEALTGEAPIPEGGHPGIQQALVAELIQKSFDAVVCEIDLAKWEYGGIDFGEEDFSVRKAAWQSIDRLVLHSDYYGDVLPECLEEVGIQLSDKEIYRSDKLTIQIWEDFLDEGSLQSEFLEDYDWRMDSLMDLPPDQAKKLTELMGLNFDRVQALPHTPSPEEVEKAEAYLWELIRKSGGEERPPEKISVEIPDSEIPF